MVTLEKHQRIDARILFPSYSNILPIFQSMECRTSFFAILMIQSINNGALQKKNGEIAEASTFFRRENYLPRGEIDAFPIRIDFLFWLHAEKGLTFRKGTNTDSACTTYVWATLDGPVGGQCL